MERAVWIILNKNFSLTMDAEIANGKVIDKKFTTGNDLWTSELPHLVFIDESIQEDYDEFISDILRLFGEIRINEVLINAKIGEESEYLLCRDPLVIRKIEEYSVDEIIE